MMINAQELLDLIAECGQSIFLEVPANSTVTVERTDYGIPALPRFNSRQVAGYIVADNSYASISLRGGSTQTDSLIAFLSANQLPRESLSPGSRLNYLGTRYGIEYVEGLTHRGAILIHKIRLKVVQS